MKNLIFTDIHLSMEKYYEQSLIFNQIKDYLFNNKQIKRLFILGDVFDNREHVTSELLNLFDTFLKSILDETNCNKIIIISGNHDKPYDDSNKSYLTIFKRIGVVIIDNEKDVLLLDDMLFIPFLPDERFIKFIKKYKFKEKVKYVFTHIGFQNVKFNTYRESEGIISNNIFVGYENLKKIFTGHFHNKIFYKERKLFYIGNVLQLDFGEDLEKGFLIFNDENGNTLFVKTNYPKYITCKFRCNTKDYKECFEIIKNNEGNNLRLVFYDIEQRMNTIPEDEFMNNSKCLSLKIERKIIEKNNDDYEENTVIEFNNIKDAFKEYSLQEKMTNKEFEYGNLLLERNK